MDYNAAISFTWKLAQDCQGKMIFVFPRIMLLIFDLIMGSEWSLNVLNFFFAFLISAVVTLVLLRICDEKASISSLSSAFVHLFLLIPKITHNVLLYKPEWNGVQCIVNKLSTSKQCKMHPRFYQGNLGNAIFSQIGKNYQHFQEIGKYNKS